MSLPKSERDTNAATIAATSVAKPGALPGAMVYHAIIGVMAELGRLGISKDRKNTSQGFNFRGVDDVYAALNPLLVKYGLAILPCVLERESSERPSKSGGALLHSVVKVEFQIVSAHDGSWHKVTTYGEGMDSGDKATSKAMSVAYKYAMFEAFCIPVVGLPDADYDSPEPAVTDLISAEQVLELTNLISKTDSDKTKLLAMYGAESLPKMTVANYADAKGKLNKKAQKNGNVVR